MKIALSILAVLSLLLGVVIGGMGIWIIIAGLWQQSDPWTFLVFLPFVCFGTIAVIVGLRYLRHQDTAHARGIAGMVGFFVWTVLNAGVASVGSVEVSDRLFLLHVFGPIVGGYFVYRIFFRVIRNSLEREQDDQEPNSAIEE